MMTTLPEPRILDQLRNFENIKIADPQNEVRKFLKEQYDYEKQRVPTHWSFEENYPHKYYEANAMLNYYMNPTGSEKVQYIFTDTESYEIVIAKRTLK